MANTKSAAKRARQTLRGRIRNQSVLTGVKSSQKRLSTELKPGNKDAARKQFQMLVSALDKAAKRGVIPQNAADRKKSRLNKALSALG